jgi:hypothetical protein
MPVIELAGRGMAVEMLLKAFAGFRNPLREQAKVPMAGCRRHSLPCLWHRLVPTAAVGTLPSAQ